MPKVNDLVNVNFRDLLGQSKATKNEKPEEVSKEKDFGQTISDFIKAVNDKQTESSTQVQDVIEGKSQNLHQAMASMEESKLSFQLMIEIRNKLLESYKEVQRMQV